ncbi:unnamed protein product [Caenorhabditis nigoni]
MGSVKWLMLNLHTWSSLSDLVMSFIGIPYILLPAPAGYGLGFVDAPRLMIYLLVTLLAAIAASIVALYENRFFKLFAQKSRWATIRKPFLFFIFTIVPIFFLPPFFNIPDQETSLQIVLSRIPCQSPVTYKNRKIYVLSLDLILPLICIATGTTIHAISSITFGALIFINLAMLRNKIHSEKAMEVHRKFANALTIQSAFLLSVVLAPVLALLWIMATHHHDQALNNFVFITLSLHDTIMHLLGSAFSDTFQRLSIWLALVICFYDVMKISKPNDVFKVISLLSLMSVIWSYLVYFQNVIQPVYFDQDCTGTNITFSEPRYQVIIALPKHKVLYGRIQILDAIVKIVPTVMECILMMVLLKNEKARCTDERTKRENVTKLILVFMIPYLLTGVPSTLATCLKALTPDDSLVLSFSTYTLILPVLNSISHFFICLVVSPQCQNSLLELFGKKRTENQGAVQVGTNIDAQ